MAIIYDYVPPAELTGYVRTLPMPSQILLQRYLPDRPIRDIEALITDVTKKNRAAKFRSYDAETPIGRRDSFTQRKVLLPPLGQKTVITELERIQLERLRTGGNSNAAIVEAIYDDAEINANSTNWRMEVARGDVLVDGKFTLAGENGLYLEADFAVPSSHIVSAGTAWTSTTTATPFTDMRAWRKVYIDDVGEPPGRMCMSSDRVTDLLLNAEIRALFATVAGTPSIVTEADLSRVLQAHGLPPIETYDSKVEIDGTDTRVTPADRVFMLPANAEDLGYTAWGITAEALELAGEQNPSLDFEQAPGLVGVVTKEGDPVRVWTKVAAVGMPVLTDPKRLLVADVA